MSRSKKSGNPKTEMTLVRNPEVDDVAALFEQLTGRKPTAAEMLEVERTLNDVSIKVPVPTFRDRGLRYCGVAGSTPKAQEPRARRQMGKLPPNVVDVTAQALGKIVCMVPAPQVAQPPNADTDRSDDALRDTEKPLKRRQRHPR
jgi:hypothetical protein